MVSKIKYLILGAGPSGLALAAGLLKAGEKNFLVLEKESQPGGLCRSKEVDNAPLDIGGGHLLDVRRQKVLDFVFSYLPKEEWNLYDRISKIRTAEFELDYPYEANIWQLPVEAQVEHLISLKNSGSSQGKPMPKSFRKWIEWKLGDVIARNYMLPYNAKIFSSHLDDLGTYWLYKLPDVSFEDTLRACLYHMPYGSLPAHARFYYPKKYGYGEFFLRLGDSLGNHLRLETPVRSFDADTLTVNGDIQAEYVINTIPWQALRSGKGVPAQIRRSIDALKHSSIDIVYRPNETDTDAHWIYYPEESLSYHRILYRKNFLPGSHGYWEEVNSLRMVADPNHVHHNEYAYPLNTRSKPMHLQRVIDWAKSRSIMPLGRWGEWEHMNSDVAMNKALDLAEELTK